MRDSGTIIGIIAQGRSVVGDGFRANGLRSPTYITALQNRQCFLLLPIVFIYAGPETPRDESDRRLRGITVLRMA